MPLCGIRNRGLRFPGQEVSRKASHMGYIGLPQGKVNNPCCGSPKADVSVGDHQGEELLRPLVLSLDSSRDMFLFLKSISLPSLPVIPVLPSGVTKDTCLPSSL